MPPTPEENPGTTSDSDFFRLLERVRQGDPQATAELLQNYESEVLMVVRVRLGRPLRPYLDSIDVVQSVHRSILDGLQDDRFELTDPKKLIALAAEIACRKIARQWRKLKRQQRLGDDDVTIEELAEQVFSQKPAVLRPDEVTDIRERLQRLLNALDPLMRRIVALRCEGHTTAEAARMMDMDPDAVRANLSRMRRQLRQLGIDQQWL